MDLLPKVLTTLAEAWGRDGTSWASLTATGHGGPVLVREGGPHRLAQEVLAAWDTWLAHGSPDLYDYGLTVTEHTQYAWALDPATGPRWPLGADARMRATGLGRGEAACPSVVNP